ncbi:MAG: hypothetical protein R3B40_26955 [Polyangiales bacterium]|nr:hypothetical protein [Myxococcales bacterium]MCB9660244.1 hypothetical protein [Sandaracinaceae bacterium]
MTCRSALALVTLCAVTGCAQAHPVESSDAGRDVAVADAAVVRDGSGADASFDASVTPADAGPPRDAAIVRVDGGGGCYLPDTRPDYPPLQAGSFCDVVWVHVPSNQGVTAAEVAAFSDRFYGCDDNESELCRFAPSTTAHLTVEDMDLLCAAEEAFPPLEWTCIIYFT